MREFHYDAGHNFLWVDSIVGGTIPNNFLPAVDKGFRERMDRGIIAGYPVKNIAIEVFFGKYHDVDSSEAAFKTAGAMAFRNVFQEAKPVLHAFWYKQNVAPPAKVQLYHFWSSVCSVRCLAYGRVNRPSALESSYVHDRLSLVVRSSFTP